MVVYSATSSSVGFSAFPMIAVLFLVVLVVLVVLSILFKAFGKTVGTILSISGIIAILYGIVRSNSLESQFTRVLGESDEVMMLCFILGGISLVIGIIFFAIGCSGKKPPLVYNQSPVTPGILDYAIKIRCPNCQGLNDETAKYCGVCGHPMNPSSLET